MLIQLELKLLVVMRRRGERVVGGKVRGAAVWFGASCVGNKDRLRLSKKGTRK